MTSPSGLTPDALRKDRRAFEEELRRELLELEKRGLLDEGEDLLFRLRQKIKEKVATYLKV